MTGPTQQIRESSLINENWRFARFGAMPEGGTLDEPSGLEAPNFDDQTWRQLDLPHDWGVEGPFRKDLPNRTGKLPWAGIGWYRRTLNIPESDRGKRIFIDFDGAMSQAKVWLNGEYVGTWPYGYASFRLELTPHVQFGADNILAVRLDNPPESSRWYPGGGIYRNVHLVKTAPIHVAQWGTRITTPRVTNEEAEVTVETTVENATDSSQQVVVRHRLFNDAQPPKQIAELVTVEATIPAGASAPLTATTTLKDFQRWDIEDPRLYFVETSVCVDDTTVDTYRSRFGIRTIEFDADTGFRLNGRAVKLQGVCMHHDQGALGGAVHTRAIERQLQIMRDMGANAIRTSHNPPAPELVELCDRMGLLLQVEAFDCWETNKTENDYGCHFNEWHERDLRAMVRRDMNSPSIIMWSIGNEILEQRGKQYNPDLGRRLSKIVRDEDPTRPTTVCCNAADSGFNEFADVADLFGYNYKPHLYEEFRKKNPHRPLYGSETASTVSSRGEYFFPVHEDKTKGGGGYFQVSSYDLYTAPWATIPDTEFAAQDRLPEVFGEFVWTGFDYLGEPTPYNKDSTNMLNFDNPEDQRKIEEEMARLGGFPPPRSAYFGIVDLCGFPKDRYYLYQAHWRPDLPMAHILPHWSWPERVGEITPVHVYTSGDEAELFLNGTSLGRKKKAPFTYRLRWDDVVYAPGELKVMAYKDGKPWAEATQVTAGPAAKLALTIDRDQIHADGCDLSFVKVTVTDAEGRMVPRSDALIRFHIEGPGEIVVTDNGDPVTHEPFQSTNRKAFNGLALAIVRSLRGKSGKITVIAESDGLTGQSVHIEAS